MLAGLQASSLPARHRAAAQLVSGARGSAYASQIAFKRLLSSLPRAGTADSYDAGAPDVRALTAASSSRFQPVPQRPRGFNVGMVSPLLLSPALLRLRPTLIQANAFGAQLARGYGSGRGRDPWRRNDWLTPIKYGALFALGAGAVIVSTSFAFSLIIPCAAAYGVYSLYQKFFGPYRSRYGSSSDPFGDVNSNIDRLKDMFSRDSSARPRRASSASSDLDSLVQGLPFVVRGVVKSLFSLVGSAMQSSMERAGELRRRVNEQLQANQRIVADMGDDVNVSTPQQWMESSVNGVGRIEAVFPVVGASYGGAFVTVKASIDNGGLLNIQELKYRNNRTGEVIDLLRDASQRGERKTVIDAEYVDLDDTDRRSSRW